MVTLVAMMRMRTLMMMIMMRRRLAEVLVDIGAGAGTGGQMRLEANLLQIGTPLLSSSLNHCKIATPT